MPRRATAAGRGDDEPPLTLPGSLARCLHEIGLGRRALPDGDDAKRHHFIAQLILRRFIDTELPGERLWQLDKQSGKVVATTTDGAGSRHRLYRVRNQHGELSNHLEGFFSLVESHAAPSLRALDEDPLALDVGDRVNISLFLALQDQRTPAGQARAMRQIATAERLHAATRLEDARRFARTYRKRVDRHASPAAIERARLNLLRELRDGEIIMEAEKEHALNAMLGTWLHLGGAIHELSWKIASARDGEFVIGDRPLTLHDPAPPFPWSGNGLKSSPAAYGLMPLAPEMCLRLDQHGAEIEERSWSCGGLVTKTNLASYGWAERYIYGRDSSVLEDLHRRALSEPDAVPTPRPDPQVIFEEADPDDPDVGTEHPAGYPRGFWLPGDDGTPMYHRYTLVYTDDPRTPTIRGCMPR